jgi:hypothetical protein
MPTVDKMNQDIAMWLYGGSKKDTRFVFEKQKGVNGKVRTYWKLVRKVKFGNTTVDKFLTDKWECSFHSNYEHIMKAYEKFLQTDGNWYATYRNEIGEWEGKGRKKKYIRKPYYSCPLTTGGFSRIGYGEKFNKQFYKLTLPEAMQYSLYRFIKNGREY